MRIESGFTVPAPPDDAYEFLLDLERVAPCIPGGTLGEPDTDGVYPASVAVRLGPMRLTYDGSIKVADADPCTRTATLSAQARETRGNGAVSSTMTMLIAPEGSGSAVTVTADLELTGRAARMGRGIVDDVAKKLVAEMATCLAARLSSESPNGSPVDQAPAVAKPVGMFALFGHALRVRVGGLFSRREHRG